MQNIHRVNELLASLPDEPPDIAMRHKVDTFHLSYVEFSESFVLPGFPLTGENEAETQEVLEIARKYIPHFLAGTELLPEPRPRKDPRQLHFVREFRHNSQSYLYILRLHLDYMGGASDEEIEKPPSQGRSASFRTNRFYFQARLLPVESVLRREGAIVDFEASQMKETLFEVSSSETMRELWTSVLFDEVDFSELNQMFCKYFRFESEWQPKRLFYPFVVDYLTVCLNLINPDTKIIEAALPHLHEGYTSFIKNQERFEASAPGELFWSSWYAAHRTRLSPARSGNPHWSFESYPDRKWLKEL